MFTVFIVIQILLTIALVGLILVQRNDSDGLGSMGGGGGGNAFMTGRGVANFMTRSTAIVATLFMLNSLWLAMIASNKFGEASLVEEIENADDVPAISVPLADEPKATAPKPLSPEMPVMTTEEPSGEPVAVDPANDDASEGTDADSVIPTP